MESITFYSHAPHNLIFQFDLENLSAYFHQTEEFLVEEERKFLAKMEEEVKGMSPDLAEEFYDWKSDDWSAVHEGFPKTLRYSLVVALYSSLETYVGNISTQARRDKEALLKPEEIAGNAILFKHQTYLKKVIELKFPDQSAAWQHIVGLNRVRNTIVHNQGLVNRKDEKLMGVIETNRPNLSISSELLMVTPGYLFQTIDFLKTFGNELATSYKEFLSKPAT